MGEEHGLRRLHKSGAVCAERSTTGEDRGGWLETDALSWLYPADRLQRFGDRHDLSVWDGTLERVRRHSGCSVTAGDCRGFAMGV